MLDKQETYLDHNGITIKKILGNFDRREDCMQRYLYEHFQLPDHTGFLQDTYVTLIDKTDPRALRKREDCWIRTLKTKASMGLNVEGGY